MTDPITSITAASDPQERAELRQAAKGFEAVFVRRMLEAARATDFGGGDVFGGQAMETYGTMRDEYLADIAASTGAFGIAEMIERQLSTRLPDVAEDS